MSTRNSCAIGTRTRRFCAGLLAAIVLLLPARRASADPAEPGLQLSGERGEVEQPLRRRLRFALMVTENLAVLLPPTLYYLATTNVQRQDFEMDWDWASWKKKLTSLDAFILDTNDWVANSVRHPIAGALSYQTGRANGYGPVASTAIDLLTALAWEYVVEYREKISINDIVVNMASGFVLGEPLFQLGRLASQPGASWSRRNLALLVSPVDRLHTAMGYGSWLAPFRPWTRLEASLGAGGGSYHGESRGDVTLGLDLELVNNSHYARPGSGATWTRAGMWNRFVADLRFLPTDISHARVMTQTTYFGQYTRELDADRVGTDWFVGAAGGLEYDSTRLADHEWDQMLVLHLFGPRLALGRWNGEERLLWEITGSGDIGMNDAHVFGPDNPFDLMPQTSVLQSRGYYYAKGVSVASRLRLDASPWHAELEGRAFQMWSIDGYDRVELAGAPVDPHDVADQRLFGRAAVGVEPSGRDVRLQLDLEGALRRGTWRDQVRQTGELSLRGSVVFGF